ncbi:MAG: hypothetical protein IJR26_04640 [Bacteroidales bacterium]|nr:hypothetical protein [Bacteroidales bacterium]
MGRVGRGIAWHWMLSHWQSWEALPPTVGGRASQPDQSEDNPARPKRGQVG